MLRRKYINEARIQRDVDPGIWASMSSMSSRMRKLSSDGSDIKVKRNDDADTLLQKYVAGLLTMKSECPQTESDIDRIGVYSPLGRAYLNAGGSMSAIQNKYVTNGGTVDFEISSEPVRDFPSYEEADSIESEDLSEPEEIQRELDNHVENIIDNEPIVPDTEDIEPEEDPIDIYLRTVFRKINKARPGDYLSWDDQDGLIITEDDYNSFAICVEARNKFIDDKPRFMFKIQSKATLNNPGNNGEYDDFYFKARMKDEHYTVIPGNNYHYREMVNGKHYTDILYRNNNGAAVELRNMIIETLRRIDRGTGELSAIAEYISRNAYLPTLLELSYAFDNLTPGIYCTSSVTDNGRSNILYQISSNKDKFLKGDSPNDSVNVVAFITF